MPYFAVNQVTLYYEVNGEGTPVLLIPGLGSDANTWAPLFPAFQDRYSLILLENRGSGRSGKPEESYNTGQMAKEAVALLDHLQIQKAHVIGKSMGGMIAQILAASHPERVRSLVLASTLMQHDSYGHEMLELGRALAEKAGLFETYRMAFLLSYSKEYCMSHRDRLSEAREMIDRVGGDKLLLGYLRQSHACSHHDSRDAAKRIQTPSLVLVGKDDIFTTPQHSRELAASITGSELVVFPKGGHGVWREFPEMVNPVVREFLDRN